MLIAYASDNFYRKLSIAFALSLNPSASHDRSSKGYKKSVTSPGYQAEKLRCCVSFMLYAQFDSASSSASTHWPYVSTQEVCERLMNERNIPKLSRCEAAPIGSCCVWLSRFCIELDSALLKSKRIDLYLDADRCGHTKGDIDVFDNLLVSPDVLSTCKRFTRERQAKWRSDSSSSHDILETTLIDR